MASDLVGYSREYVGLRRDFRVGFKAVKFGRKLIERYFYFWFFGNLKAEGV
jgi:hypothetical protein